MKEEDLDNNPDMDANEYGILDGNVPEIIDLDNEGEQEFDDKLNSDE
jgi:hypothetical protein